jgi:hypothetical protein
MRERERERESHALHTEELRASDLPFRPAVARFFKNLFERAHLFGLFQEQPHGLFQILERLVFAATARGNVQLQSVSYKGAALFENAGCELSPHRLAR